MVTKVPLPRRVTPQFPDRCVVCGSPAPTGSAVLHGRDSAMGRAWWAGWRSIEVPSCLLCGFRLHAFRLTRSFVSIGIVITAWAIFFFLKARIGGIGAGVSAFAAGLLGLAGYAAWGERHPPPFDFEPRQHAVIFLFRDPGLGQEFSVLNPGSAEAGRLTSA